MYGARATMGKLSLDEVERELRIKAKFLEAIERVDLERLPSTAYLASFVRTYARYLESELPLTPDQAVRKFAREYETKAGKPLPITEKRTEKEAEAAEASARAASRRFGGVGRRGGASKAGDEDGEERISPAEREIKRRTQSKGQTQSQRRSKRKLALDDEAVTERKSLRISRRRGVSETDKLTARKPAAARRRGDPAARRPQKNFKAGAKTATPAPERANLAPLAMAGVAVGIVGGLAYGAWSVLESAQRVTAQDTAVAAATVLEQRDVLGAGQAADRPSSETYEEDGVLTQIYEPPPTPRADGPIADLDPEAVGVFAPTRGQPAEPPRSAELSAAPQATLPNSVIAAVETLGQDQQPAVEQPTVETRPAATATREPGPRFAVRALSSVWLKVQGADGSVLFSGNLGPGEMRELPTEGGPVRIRSGNAGGTAIVVDGVAYGPLGPRGAVRSYNLGPGDVSARLARMPAATAEIAREAGSVTAQ